MKPGIKDLADRKFDNTARSIVCWTRPVSDWDEKDAYDTGMKKSTVHWAYF